MLKAPGAVGSEGYCRKNGKNGEWANVREGQPIGFTEYISGVQDLLKQVLDDLSMIRLSKFPPVNQETLPTKRLLSLAEAAQYIGVGKTRFGENFRKYVVPVKNGRNYLIPKEELDAWIEQAKRKGDLFY